MEKLSIARAQLKAADESFNRNLKALMAKFDDKENALKERLGELNKKRFDPERANLNASDDDLVEINAGGKIVAAKRSVLTQLKGTRLEALFSGRWEKELQRDGRGRIFIDVNPLCFRAIVDYLNELAISSEDNPPNPPCVDTEHRAILRQYLNLFGVTSIPDRNIPDSAIIKSVKDTNLLHDWLEEDGSDGDFCLLYRSSRDGPTVASFRSKCNNQGCTITIIETADGYFFGGYSNTPWHSSGGWCAANKAFLFVLSGSDISSPLKMKLKNANDGHAIYVYGHTYGPTFGVGNDLKVHGTKVYLNFGYTYEPGPSGQLARKDQNSYAAFDIKEMEVFRVSGEYAPSVAVAAQGQAGGEATPYEPVTIFTENVNQAINARQDSLLQVEAEILHLEESFADEKRFIAAFATGEVKDVVVLNVSGAIMTSKRSTLQAVEDSVLAQQFDDTKWTEHGTNVLRVKEWAPSDVGSWADNISGIQEDVSKIFKKHNINGRELVALDREGLKMLGVNRPGTLCLLLDEIAILKEAFAAFLEHSPYCFGKILDYLRLKQIHSQGLVEEPALPRVCDLQRGRFEKVVQYYFPGDSAKLLLG